jgi:ferredoxin
MHAALPPATLVAPDPERNKTKMADPNDKVPGQAPGRYFVDTQCIDCDLCRETAPANFTRNDGEGFSYVYKQPENDEEEALSKDAMDNCPVEAIGNEGG